MTATHNDEHKIPATGNTKGSAETPERTRNQTEREGPARVSHELDRQEQWDDAASHEGFQKGEQGGYKGDYDQGKYENRDFGFTPSEDESQPDAGGGQGKQQENKQGIKQVQKK
ncbi:MULTISPECIES: hypothetical protein [unclassified Achromobacter]|uniref:hypothetical protein n=1 Tax=unclassified Achromobacter TaxID=2626865 RepID=UPI000B51B345|nr:MULTISPECIES: hypothetical protein [unclassified Achromobacter]OWT67930.1 hypothetical protein CEY05_30270 [Achromobacter sp. HZ34]OWT67996.1 hypothetical protein CEY04_29925 [Achromobacter sp. HZ28]